MWKRILSGGTLVLAVAAAPLAAAAAEGEVGGHGPRIRAHDGRLVAAPQRPVFVVWPELAAFGRMPPEEAPPLVIEVKGDVEITPQPDGGLRIRFLEDDE